MLNRVTQYKLSLSVILIMTGLIAHGCSATAASPARRNDRISSSPRLILFLVSDQFSHDYLDRLNHLWTGGIRTLLTKSANFTEAFHRHAITETCPGHASLITGTHPSKSGIVANNWFDRFTGEEVYCVDDQKFQKSPRNLLTPTLGDWMKSANPKSKVFSVSAKDRAAVILGGHTADGAYWYDKKTGRMISSAYYPEATAPWLTAFNSDAHLDRLYGTAWNPRNLTQKQLKVAGAVETDRDCCMENLPRPLGDLSPIPTASFYSDIAATPMIDELVELFSETLLAKTRLGKDNIPDLLAISFSAVDTVGHQFGPHSRQQIDNLLRLDQTLERLFSSIERSIGLENVLVVFSADHGVQAFPEVQNIKGLRTAKRVGLPEYKCLQNIVHTLPPETQFSAPWYLKTYTAKDSQEQIRANIAACPNIEKVWLASELTNEDHLDHFHKLFKNSFHPKRSPDFLIQWKRNFLPTRRGTNHGTPYKYDSHVPLLIMGTSVNPSTVTQQIATVDVAPLLADIANIPTPMKETPARASLKNSITRPSNSKIKK